MDFLAKVDRIWNDKLTRRDFIKRCAVAGISMCAAGQVLNGLGRYKAFGAIGEKRGLREALWYEKVGDNAVRCQLCENTCLLKDGQRGFCRVREPVNNKLYTLVYELVCSMHVDPVEKKPFFHVLPGTKAFSIATAGCNSRCRYCQNWTISQRSPEEIRNRRLSCSQLASSAVMNGCSSVAYTYSEPIVFYEYVMDASRAVSERGLKNLVVTGGKINRAPLEQLCKVIDAANVDLKGFDKKFLKEVCAQRLGNILDTLVILKKNDVWVEITNLIVPTLNDNMADIRKMCRWIKDELGEDVPIHFSRFWPQYKLRSMYPTPPGTLRKARETALESGLKYVYIGNVPDEDTESTICPRCQAKVIERIGYRVLKNNIKNGRCPFCGYKISGIWS